MVQRTDLKCTFYRAKFQTGVLGEAILGNEGNEYIQLPLKPATGSNTSWFGDKIIGQDELNLSTPSGTIQVGDRLIGATSGANAFVGTVSGSFYSMSGYSVSNLRFTTGESITVRRANGLVTTISTSVVSKNTAIGTIHSVTPRNDRFTFNGNTAILCIRGTNGLFKANDILSLSLSGNTVPTL
jgi:hypothetical protein